MLSRHLWTTGISDLVGSDCQTWTTLSWRSSHLLLVLCLWPLDLLDGATHSEICHHGSEWANSVATSFCHLLRELSNWSHLPLPASSFSHLQTLLFSELSCYPTQSVFSSHRRVFQRLCGSIQSACGQLLLGSLSTGTKAPGFEVEGLRTCLHSWRRGGCEASVFGDGNSSWSNRTTATVTFPSSTWTACTMGRSCLSSPELASGQPGKTSCRFPSCIPASKHQQSTSACAKTVYLGSQLALMARSSQLKPFAASGLALVQLVAFPFSASTCGQPSPFWLFS